MKQIVVFIILISSILSCSNRNEIHDLWICKHGISNKHLNQGSYPNNSLSQGWPVLLDLRDYQTAKMKIFGKSEKDFIYNITDSILSWDSLTYEIKYVTEDSLCLYFKNWRNQLDSAEFNRVIKSPIKESEIEISKRLIQNKWSRDSMSLIKPEGYLSNIEFLKNGRALNLIQSVDYFTQDSIIDYFLSLWKVEKYDHYTFMFINPMVIIGSNPYMEIYQITSFDSFKIQSFDFYNFQNFTLNNNVIKKDTLKIHNDLIGKWKSKNDTSKYYGRYSNRMEKKGYLKRYDGELRYELRTNGELVYNIEGIEPISCYWRLNKTGDFLLKTYVFEYYGNPDFVEISKIVELDESNWTLQITDNFEKTGKEKPRELLLNKEQIFKRIE